MRGNLSHQELKVVNGNPERGILLSLGNCILCDDHVSQHRSATWNGLHLRVWHMSSIAALRLVLVRLVEGGIGFYSNPPS